jgi:hypothetical protein
MALDMPKSDEDVQRDLEALFAIRDAAMADTARKPREPREQREPDHPEFEQTQPFADSDPEARRANGR